MKYKCYFVYTVVFTLCGELLLLHKITLDVCSGEKNVGSALLEHLLFANFITAFTFLLDKCLAVYNGCRIPERVLCIMTFFGAPIGALLVCIAAAIKLKKPALKTRYFVYVLSMWLGFHY